jgi:rSAM/selenodomain-associated transferase 2/rSAM/selenodomain-associated transferase 1
MHGTRKRLILFARSPKPGRVKTRLIPALGAEGAAALHRRLVLRTLRTTNTACQNAEVELEVRFAGGSEDQMRHWLGISGMCRPQSEGDLGQRMAGAFEDSFRGGARSTVIIGSDCPGLTPGLLAAAFDRLSESPATFGPANDGGYYLIGLNRMVPELFRGIAWGTETVLADSLRALAKAGLKPALLDTLDDLDRPEDLPAWQRTMEREDAGLGRVSVIVPALNEAEHIARTLEAAQRGRPHELIVVDGGSTDETRALAVQAGANVLSSPPGRSCQMNTGAARATGNALVFLHADTLLPANWAQVVSESLRRPAVVAGAFRFRIAGDFAGKWIVESTTNLRSRWFQQPYGDQALFLRRSLFEELGGFADLPIMEDYEFVRRLRRHGRVITLAESILTSGRRWRSLGVFRTTLTNKLVVGGYHLGVSPRKLAGFYRGPKTIK